MMTKEAIRAWLKDIEADERLHYKSADVVTNAPLALEQLAMETKSDVLRKILGLPHCNRNPKTNRWESLIDP